MTKRAMLVLAFSFAALAGLQTAAAAGAQPADEAEKRRMLTAVTVSQPQL